MTATEVIDQIHGSYQTGSKNGLENIRRLMALVCPDFNVPVIHIAGTNGKGSTCAMLESILRTAGYRTGLYTSPFLQKYQERIRLNGQLIADELVVKYGEKLLIVADQLRQEGNAPTPFELGTALALMTFQGENVDFAVVEVGMGGRLDPTNIVSPIVCGIAAIGMDHTQYLGNTLAEIAAEKAGIIKEGVPVVCHPAEVEVAAVFHRVAAEKHALLVQLEASAISNVTEDMYGSTADFALKQAWQQLRINLPGAHQCTNALVVLGIIEQLRQQSVAISDKAVAEGISRTIWSARLEWCGNVLIDGAHNAQGIASLKAYVTKHLYNKKKVLLSGVLTEKLSSEMLADLASLAGEAFTVTPDTPRAMSAEEYALLLQEQGMMVRACDSVKDGLEKALKAAGVDGVVIAAGSLYFAGELRTTLQL